VPPCARVLQAVAPRTRSAKAMVGILMEGLLYALFEFDAYAA